MADPVTLVRQFGGMVRPMLRTMPDDDLCQLRDLVVEEIQAELDQREQARTNGENI